MTSERYNARYKDAPWYKQYLITVGGLGGIGSWLAPVLARGGHSLYLFDGDTIEPSNIGGQFFYKEQVGRKKNASVLYHIERMTDNVEVNLFDMYTPSTNLATRIMFSCFDNMTARKLFFEKWLGYYRETEKSRARHIDIYGPHSDTMPYQWEGPACFIDGRLEAETGILYCVRNEQEAERWLSEWFPDEKLANHPCTFAATTNNAMLMAGLMVSTLNNVITNYVENMDMRVRPYKTTWDLPTMTFNSEETVPNPVPA